MRFVVLALLLALAYWYSVRVGMRVRSPIGTAFRQWATTRLSELLVKGFTLDDERIKSGRTLERFQF